MSKVKRNGRDGRETLELDRHFREIFNRTKSFLQQVNNQEHVKIYSKWLERLSGSTNQRKLRNQYIIELFRQLKTGNVGEIFCKPPPRTALIALTCKNHLTTRSSSLTKCSGDQAICQSCNKPRSQKSAKQFVRKIVSSRDDESDFTTSTSQATESGKTTHYDDDNNSLQESSESLPNDCNQRIDRLNNFVKDLEVENQHLDRELLKRQQINEASESQRLRIIIKQKADEMNILKSRLLKVQQLHENAEKCHREIFHQFEITMNKEFGRFKSRLQEEELRNAEMNEKFTMMAQNFEKTTRDKEEELSSLQQHYEELLKQRDEELNLRNDTIEKLNHGIKQGNSLEHEKIASLTSKIQELEDKLQLKIQDEDKLKALLTEQYSTMKEEFSKLRNEMESANNKQNLSLIEKVSSLKKYLLKMEKSKQKLAFECQQKIFEIQKSKEFEIKTLELQLQGQRNELSTSLSTEKQCELDSLLNLLEERYKSLLASSEAMADNQRQKYLQKMTILENQVARLKSNFMKSETYV